MSIKEPEFLLWAGERDEDGDLQNDKLIYLTEEEYLQIIKYLKKKKAIDENKQRTDGKAKPTQDNFGKLN